MFMGCFGGFCTLGAGRFHPPAAGGVVPEACMCAAAGVLWSVAPSLVLFLLAYAGAATAITVWGFAKRLMQLQYRILRCEGDLRFDLVRTRENSGALARRMPAGSHTMMWLHLALFAGLHGGVLRLLRVSCKPL